MSEATALPQRAARISDEVQAEIVRLATRQVPQTRIAERLGVNRQTVRRVIARTRAAIAINHELVQERAEAIVMYREIQRTAWEAIDAGRAPGPLLAEIRQAQTRIDTLLGLAPAGPDDPVLLLQQFKTTVVNLIRDEAPELAPVLARRLLEESSGQT